MRNCSDIESSTWREDGEFRERKWSGSPVLKFLPGNPQFTVNAQHSLEGSDQQTVQPGAVQREEAFTDTEMGLGGLMGHMSHMKFGGLSYPLKGIPPRPGVGR